MLIMWSRVNARALFVCAGLPFVCALNTPPTFAQSTTDNAFSDKAPDILPWKADGEAAATATEAAKAARAAAIEAKAAAATAKASLAPPLKASAPAPAATAAPVATQPVATSSVAAPASGAAAATDSPAAKAAAGSPKIVLTPAKKLFGAAKSAAPLQARAIGSYARGCMAGGKSLAIDGPAWQAMRLSRNRNWGHPKLIELLERFATEMKTKESWPGLLIGDLAQPRGGPMLSGHKSHQVGLDADIWFKPKPSETLTRAQRETAEPLLLAEDTGTEVIAANWHEGFVRLVKRAASYPEVERIFVHPAIKKEFCKAAGTDRGWLLKVRPMWLHNYHFHVRMACPAGSPTCEHQTSPNKQDDGCGKEVEDWIKLVSAKPKPSLVPVPAPKPAAPKPEMSLEQLPVECRTVLTAGEPKDSPAQKAIAEIAAAQAAAKAEKAAKAAKAKLKAASKTVSAEH